MNSHPGSLPDVASPRAEPRAPAASPPPAEWRGRRERSNALMLRIMTWISLTLGRRVARVVLQGISLYFFAFSPKARRASRHYLTRALGRRPRWSERLGHIHAFASTIHDRVYLLNDRSDLFDLSFDGVEHLEHALAAGRGVILLGAHYGSFEVLRAVGRARGGMHIALLMYPDNARKINAALHAINPAAEHDIIALGRTDSMLRVSAALDRGHIVGILADRSLHHDTVATRRFLGADAAWPLGPLRIAALLRRPVLFMAGTYLGGNRYEVSFRPLADFSDVERPQRAQAVASALDTYVAELEACCRRVPNNWFNFFDFWAGPGPQPTRVPSA